MNVRTCTQILGKFSCAPFRRKFFTHSHEMYLLKLTGTQYLQNCNFGSIEARDFEHLSNLTLDSLSEYFENISESECVPEDFDVNLEGGVLTISVSKRTGTYVINKQAPNKQIWLSSPISGPKRYDFVNNKWVYARDGKSLHELLEEEFSKHLNMTIDLSDLPYHWNFSR